MLTPTTIHGTADVPRSHRGFVLSGVEGPLGPIDSFNPHLASIPKLSSRTGETRKPPMLHFPSLREFFAGQREQKMDSPRLRAFVANASHSFTLRTALRTNGPLATRHCFSNRHPCRLETYINSCASATSLFLIVTRRGGSFSHEFRR